MKLLRVAIRPLYYAIQGPEIAQVRIIILNILSSADSRRDLAPEASSADSSRRLAPEVAINII